MTSSSDPQQARDLGELRNHLKWLDEERRKATRKVADVEQQLAQQRSELAERDQRLEALERQIAAQAARFARLPDIASSTLQVENRLNALERQLADLHSRFVGQPTPDEEHARLSAEIEQIVAQVVRDFGQEMAAQHLEQKLASWQAMLDEQKDLVDQLSQQWLSLSNQYKEARMAVQNFANWQKELERQKREFSEMARLENNRPQSRWNAIAQELYERLSEFEADWVRKWQAFASENDQRWATSRHTEQTWREQLASLENLIHQGQQDSRSLILRVQAAQVEAIKRWPVLLTEEVEKAVEQNSQSLLAPEAAGPHTSLSVIDAIERGLITIDYESEADASS